MANRILIEIILIIVKITDVNKRVGSPSNRRHKTGIQHNDMQ